MAIFDFSDERLFNPVYTPLIEDESEFLHLWGSASSGKSYFEAEKEIILSFNPERYRRRTIVARKVYCTLRDSCFQQLCEVIYNWGLDDVFHITTSPLYIENKLTKVGFIFRGFDIIDKIKSITGADRAWYEEATEGSGPSEILQLRTRLRGYPKHQVTLTYNPTDEHHWLNTQIHKQRPPGHRFFHTTYHDNVRMLEKDPTFGPFIEGTRLTDPNYYRVYGLGLWGSVTEGLVYTRYEVEEFPTIASGKDDIHHYGLDFGFTNPTALIAQHVMDAPVRKRLYNKEIIYKPGLDGPEMVRVFDGLKVRKDRVIVADSARPEMIRTLRQAGYNVRPTKKFAGSVLSGINTVRSYDIYIDPSSREMLREIRNYQKAKLSSGIWLEEPQPNQVCHALDGMRYGPEAIPQVRRQPPVLSTSQSIFD